MYKRDSVTTSNNSVKSIVKLNIRLQIQRHGVANPKADRTTFGTLAQSLEASRGQVTSFATRTLTGIEYGFVRAFKDY
jgi:hypothetical protein